MTVGLLLIYGCI